MAKSSPKYSGNPVLTGLGTVICEVRADRGLSQESLAVDAELDRSYMGGIKRGEHNLTLINLHKMPLHWVPSPPSCCGPLATDPPPSCIVASVKTGKTNKSVIAACGRAISQILALCLVSAIAVAAEFSVLVVSVSDGDTIKVLDDSHHAHTVRLMGIDTPEKAQAYGQRSKQSLSDLVFQKTVSVQWSKRDNMVAPSARC
ncbi:MAG: thermonuclease family protein [Betaproteobacteria bacterium]